LVSESAAELPIATTKAVSAARWWHLTNGARCALAAVIVAVPALALYMRTLAPDVGFWDTGEFQALGPVLGIAHPTGYPAYTLLLWLASVVLQPFGDAALRANLLSALLVAAACGVVGATVAYLTRRLVVGVGVGIAFALCSRAWAIGLHADPHAFHLFLVSVLLLLLVVWADRQRARQPNADRLLIAAAALFGVSLANHALTLLLAPGVGLYVLLAYPGILRRFGLIATCVGALVFTTVVLYAYLPLRSAMNPPLDYANPQTWENFKYVVFGEQFTGTFHARPTPVESIRIVAEETWQQLGLLFPLSALGAIVGLFRRAALIVMLAAWFGLTFYFAIGYENADIGRYYLVPLMSVAVVAGIGAGAILEAARAVIVRFGAPRRALARLVIAAVMAFVRIGPAAGTVPRRLATLDESGDHSARNWLTSVGTALPQDAVIVSWWSYSTPMWYAQYVEGWRPDVTIIDDRTMLDEHLGSASQVIDSYLGKRPVYLIRTPNDIPQYMKRYVLTALPGIPGQPVYRVTGAAPTTGRLAGSPYL
jgi:hypothetical protein